MLSRPLATFLLIFFPAVLFILAGGWFYAESEIRYQQLQISSNNRAFLELAVQGVRQDLLTAVEDVEYLFTLTASQGVIFPKSADSRAQIVASYSAYMQAHGDIDQVRWIDRTGMELLRLDFDEGKVHVIGNEELQNKSDRDYFRRAVKLARDNIYVSPLDLNIENRRLEIPYKPTLRLAKPVYDDAGQVQGVFVINYDAGRLLDTFKSALGSFEDRGMLVNRDGYWLKGLRTEDEWGFMLGKPTATLRAAQPGLWQQIVSAPYGQLKLTNGIWTWMRIQPLETIRLGAQHEQDTISGNNEYVWYAVVQLPPDVLKEIESDIWRPLRLMLAVLIGIAAAVSLWGAWSRQKIKNLNLQLIERAAAAEEASRAKAEFLANMSHEIRTPMNAVLGLAYLLEQSRLTPDALELVHKIRSAGRSLLGIINDVLDFSKIEAGHVLIENRPFCLNDVLESLSTIMSANAANKDLELVISPPPKNCNFLRGDELRIEQILVNLCGNAIKFTERGGITVKIAVVSESHDMVTLRFAVADTGIGISQQKIDEVFLPFSQEDGSTARRFGGTGLGLSISRRLVDQMGGELGVKSEPGLGSEFWFTIPLERMHDHQAFSSPEMAGMDVLIADDSEVALDALRRISTSLGWNPITVNSGEDAIQYVVNRDAAGKTCDVIILDWKMPDVDGLSAARAIREAHLNEHDPIVIMVTAFSRNELLASPDSKLADAVLTKPVTPSTLYNAVVKALAARYGKASAHAPEDDRQPRLAGLRMLITDDNDINRDVALRIFGSEGAHVTLASNGSEALTWLQAHLGQIDIVLMDVQMPVMDGYEATKAIHRIPELANIPIVALTAGAFREQRDKAIAAGMSGFIAKPFDVDLAVSLIKNLAGKGGEPASGASTIAIAGSASVYPGLNVENGIAIWKDAAVYRHYLRKFARDYCNDARMMLEKDTDDVLSTAHRLKGVAANLGLAEVEELAGKITWLGNNGEDARAAIANLQVALTTVLSSIANYAGIEQAENDVQPAIEFDPDEVARLLGQAITALNADTPEQVEPIFLSLSKLLTADMLLPMRTAVENFDFRLAEAAARELAKELGISLEL